MMPHHTVTIQKYNMKILQTYIYVLVFSASQKCIEWKKCKMQGHMAAESKIYVRRWYFQTLISRERQLIADNMAKLSVLTLGQKLYLFWKYYCSKFFT